MFKQALMAFQARLSPHQKKPRYRSNIARSIPRLLFLLRVFRIRLRIFVVISQDQRLNRHGSSRDALIRIIAKLAAFVIGRNRTVIITKHGIAHSFIGPCTILTSLRMILAKQHRHRNLSFMIRRNVLYIAQPKFHAWRHIGTLISVIIPYFVLSCKHYCPHDSANFLTGQIEQFHGKSACVFTGFVV